MTTPRPEPCRHAEVRHAGRGMWDKLHSLPVVRGKVNVYPSDGINRRDVGFYDGNKRMSQDWREVSLPDLTRHVAFGLFEVHTHKRRLR